MQPGPRRHLPPLSALLAFERAGTRLSFRRAAGDLALTPSAVSHQIRGLEDRLGIQLFSRAHGAISLTDAGEAYFNTVSRSLNALQEATRALLEHRNDYAADLRVGVTPFFSSSVIMPALPDLRSDGRPWKLHLENTDSEVDFETSGFDIAIHLGQRRVLGLRSFPLVEVRPLPVCAPHLAAELKSPADLARQTLIHIERQPDIWRACLTAMGVPDLTPAHDLWVDSGLAAIEAAEHGLGVALAMSPLVQRRRGFGESLIAPFDDIPCQAQTYFMVCRPERADDRAILSFRRWLMRALQRPAPLNLSRPLEPRLIA